MGGEYIAGIELDIAACGSSPRGRGILVRIRRSGTGSRFIPAWAGNTGPIEIDDAKRAVHPRVGGEYVRGSVIRIGNSGSSPRGRGILCSNGFNPPPCRFIPAWAGNTATLRAALLIRPVHPRVGGEYYKVSVAGIATSGSSPRGRGIQIQYIKAFSRHRFIPAWAGNTARQEKWLPVTPVHPRVGGEYRTHEYLCIPQAGSSPRGRGIHTFFRLLKPVVRFIPAWAGNTS